MQKICVENKVLVFFFLIDYPHTKNIMIFTAIRVLKDIS